MELLFIVYHDLSEEARSQELLSLLKMYGNVTLVSYAEQKDREIRSIYNKKSQKGLLQFLINARKAIRDLNPDIVLLHDDYPMILVPYIKKRNPRTIIIQDSSELRLLSEKADGVTLKSKIAKLFRYAEKKYTKEVDIVIAANLERAMIMKDYFQLDQLPLVFDNIHRIDESFDERICQEKYGNIFNPDAFKILYAGGIAEKRLTYKIAEEIGTLGKQYQLIIVGQCENGGKEKLEGLLNDKNIRNVVYLGFTSRAELKYLMLNTQANISAFAMDTVNNINCASGKVYEGLFLGKPLLAGANPPLKRLCDKYGVGISSDNFAFACRRIHDNYQMYVNNVTNYIASIDYDSRLERLKKDIDQRLIMKKS